MIENGFIDGVFDFLHYGHIMALFQSKQKCNTLFAATHLDEEVLLEKGAYPIFDYNKRYNLLSNCKFIDVLCDAVPYNTTIEILNSLNCQQFFHGEDNIDKNPILEIKKNNKLTIYNRTIGVSTTNLIERIKDFKENKKVKQNNDFTYLNYLFDKLNTKVEIRKNTDKIVLLKCSWDILNVNHINLIYSIKQKYPNYLLYIDLVSEDLSYNIFNKEEMAITLLGIKNIDTILFKKINTINCTDLITINTDLFNDKSKNDTSFLDQIQKLNNYKLDIISNIDMKLYYKKLESNNSKSLKHFPLKVYNDIIESQFNNIILFIKSIDIKDNDIIIFDIDEVCLNNLMYNDINSVDFENGLYNFKNGLIPLNASCKPLFNYIHSNHIKYSFITGRKDYIRQITIENLDLVNLNKYIDLYTCINDYTGDINIYKEECKKDTINKGYNIICCIGDQISDISGTNYGIPFLIFNPFYSTN